MDNILEPFNKDSTKILEPDNDDLEKGNLFLGNVKAAQPYNLAPKKIKAVLTVANDIHVAYDNDIAHLKLEVMDIENQNLAQHFQQCFNFIDDNLQKGNVLVHCMAGVSRSAAVVIAYLMKKRHYTFQQAFEFVKIKRLNVWPNDGFIQQLKAFEQQTK